MIVVDIETTGINPNKHSILSIGAVDFANSANQFYGECKIWEGAEITAAALQVNGFTEAQAIDREKQTERELLQKFFEWAENITPKIFVGHNVHFDRGFLNVRADSYGLKWKFGHRIIDLHSIGCAERLRKGESLLLNEGRSDLTSDKLFEYVGLPPEPKPHHGLTGAKMAAEAFARIVNGKSLFLEFKQITLK